MQHRVDHSEASANSLAARRTGSESPKGPPVVAYTHAAVGPPPAHLRPYLDQLLDGVADRGFQLAGLFYDVGRRREGLEGAIAAIEAGDAKVLVVPRLDRLGRHMESVLGIFDRLRAAGGELLSLDQGNVAGLEYGMALLALSRALKHFEQGNVGKRDE